MNSQSKFDSLLKSLTLEAEKIFPGHKINFHLQYFEKINEYQVAISKDYGSGDSKIFWIQADGSSAEEAILLLANKFLEFCDKAIAVQSNEWQRLQSQCTNKINTLTLSQVNIENIINS